MKKNAKTLVCVCACLVLWAGAPFEVRIAEAITILSDPIPPPLLIPEGGARIKFISLTATSSEPAVIRSMTVQQGGTAPSEVLSTVVVTDEFGRRLGDGSLVGSEATIALDLALLPGRSYEITVAGEFKRDLSASHDQTVTLSVTQIDASLPVDGSFPIVGATQAIDSVTVGSLDILPTSGLANEPTAAGHRDQFLGQFRFDVGANEPVIIAGPEFDIFVSTASPFDIQEVKLFDEQGNLLAGPVDADDTFDPFKKTLTFYELFTLDPGSHVVTVRGTLEGIAFTGDTIAVSALPQQWHIIRGATYGYELVRPRDAVISDSVPILGPSLVIRLFDTNAPPRDVIAGLRQVEVGAWVLDATSPSEDFRVFELVVSRATTNGLTPNDLNNCQLYDGITSVGTSSQGTPETALFTFDPPLFIQHGTVKVLSLRCDIPTTPGGSFQFGVIDTGTNINARCINSNLPIQTTYLPSPGQLITIIASGRLMVQASPTARRGAQIRTNSLIAEFVMVATGESVSGNGATIDVPATLMLTTNSPSASFQDISSFSLVSDAGNELGTGSATLNDSLHAVISFSCNANCRFQEGVPTIVRIKGDIDSQFFTGDRLTLEIDGAKCANFRGESSSVAVPVDGDVLIAVILQCAVAQLDVIRVIPAQQAGMNDLIELGFFVADDRLYHIETSTDMVVWQRVTPFPLQNSSGYIRYFFEVPPNLPQLFFRAVAVQ